MFWNFFLQKFNRSPPNRNLKAHNIFPRTQPTIYLYFQLQHSTYLRPPSVLGSLKALDDKSYYDATPKINESKSKIDSKSLIDSTSLRSDERASDTSSARARKSSLKRKKSVTKDEEDTTNILNNNSKTVGNSNLDLGKNNSQIIQRVNRIQNDTQGANRSSSIRRNSVRRTSSVRTDSHPGSLASNYSGGSHSKYHFNKSHQYYSINRKNSLRLCDIKTPAGHRRRISSLDHPFEKSSSINLHNLEEFQAEFQRVKIEARKSIANITTTIQLEQVMLDTNIRKKKKGRMKQVLRYIAPKNYIEDRENYSLYIFPPDNR